MRCAVAACVLVRDVRTITEDQEPVGEALRDPDARRILSSKLYSDPPPECRRDRTQIDSDIEDHSTKALHDLALRSGSQLVVQAAQDPTRE